jgi:hypothetical protein
MASQRQVAKQLGISQPRVNQLIRQGILPPAAPGDYSISTCEYLYREWQQHLEHCYQLCVPTAEIVIFWYEKKLHEACYGKE